MTNLEIKTQLESILSKVDANTLRAWNYDLEDTTEAIAIEDHYGDEDINSPSVRYNGWLNDLENLIKNID
jgi:hypothetical protein